MERIAVSSIRVEEFASKIDEFTLQIQKECDVLTQQLEPLRLTTDSSTFANISQVTQRVKNAVSSHEKSLHELSEEMRSFAGHIKNLESFVQKNQNSSKEKLVGVLCAAVMSYYCSMSDSDYKTEKGYMTSQIVPVAKVVVLSILDRFIPNCSDVFGEVEDQLKTMIDTYDNHLSLQCKGKPINREPLSVPQEHVIVVDELDDLVK